MKNKSVILGNEKRSYNCNYVMTEQNLNKINDFLCSLGNKEDYTIKYSAKFENNHEISRNTIAELAEESSSRKCLIKELTIIYRSGSYGADNYVDIAIYFFFSLDLFPVIVTDVSCQNSFENSHKLEGYINTSRNKNTLYRWCLVILFTVILVSLFMLYTPQSNEAQILTKKQLIKEMLQKIGGIVLLLPAIVLGLNYLLLKIFPKKIFAIGYGEKKHTNIMQIRNVIFIAIGLATIVGLFTNYLSDKFLK